MTKVDAIKSSAIIFSLIRASPSVESEAGPWGMPIYQDGHRSVQCERWTAVGRQEMQPGRLGNALIHRIRLGSDSSLCYGAPGETKTTLP